MTKKEREKRERLIEMIQTAANNLTIHHEWQIVDAFNALCDAKAEHISGITL